MHSEIVCRESLGLFYQVSFIQVTDSCQNPSKLNPYLGTIYHTIPSPSPQPQPTHNIILSHIIYLSLPSRLQAPSSKQEASSKLQANRKPLSKVQSKAKTPGRSTGRDGMYSKKRFIMILVLLVVSPRIGTFVQAGNASSRVVDVSHRMLPKGIQNMCGASYSDALACGTPCPGVSRHFHNLLQAHSCLIIAPLPIRVSTRNALPVSSVMLKSSALYRPRFHRNRRRVLFEDLTYTKGLTSKL
jgi:hypothetical protein